MASAGDSTPIMTDVAELQRVLDLLGGARTFRRPLRTPLDAHEAILEGLPARAATHLVEGLTSLERSPALEKAMGMSLRTFQRRRGAPARRLSLEQSARTWKLAEILARASEVFGSRDEAEKWLERPATGLNRRRPIDLLATPAGVELVEDFLTQLEYGVYA